MTIEAERIPEDWYSTIAHRAGTDPTLPVGILALEAETLRTGTRSNDQGIRGLGLLIFLELAPVTERTCGQIDLGNSLGDDLRAES